VLVVVLIASLAPPNSWDSMVYHMGRVVHWIENRNVDHYPTNITRQLISAPWAEYAIAQLQILSGGDHFANLVEWFALLGCVVAATDIAGRLGVTRQTVHRKHGKRTGRH